jgi:pimeloyl-ACP methyl ester carboxylesterase
MPKTRANGIDIEYETFGKSENRPLVLIMGIGSQMVSWPMEFCEKLVAGGHFVVRFDNRDVGLTTKLDDSGIPNIWEALAAVQAGRQFYAPYRLSDMAMDTVGLMDSLNIKKAHICGISMGGMIAQTIAIEHQHRVKSLISMESTTGEPGLPLSKPEVREALIKPSPGEREAYIQHMLEVFRLFAGGSEKFDEDSQRVMSGLSYERSPFHPAGFARQYVAILTSGSRRKALASVHVPSLVIHGAEDPLLPWMHGKDTADAITEAKFLMIKGLGHGMAYPRLWDEIVEAITAHTKAAESY